MKNGLWITVPVCLAVLLISCGIFETRDPEQPGQSGSNFIPPTEPLLVFSNMENAFKGLNTENYLRSFSTIASANRNFIFVPTPEASQNFGGVFADWTRDSEQKYFDYMKPIILEGSTPTLDLGTPVALSIPSDSVRYEATYQLTIPHTQPGVPTVAKGKAIFDMIVDKSGTWVIWRWEDVVQPQDSVSWSDIKGQFGQ